MIFHILWCWGCWWCHISLKPSAIHSMHLCQTTNTTPLLRMHEHTMATMSHCLLADKAWASPPHFRNVKCVSELPPCPINWDLSKVSQSVVILWNGHVVIFYIYVPWYPNPTVAFPHSLFIHPFIHPCTQSTSHLLKACSLPGIILSTENTKIVNLGSWPLWNLQQKWEKT